MVQKHFSNFYHARTAGKLSGARRAAMMLLLMMLTMTAQTAWADTGYNYKGADGTMRNTYTDDHISDDDVTVLTTETSYLVEDCWYYVSDDVNLTNGISIIPPQTETDHYFHLILADGASLTINHESGSCIYIGERCSLTIYGQTNGTGTLNVTSQNYSDAIESGTGSSITLYGGIINANADGSHCGISVSNIYLAGATVYASKYGGNVSAICKYKDSDNNVYEGSLNTGTIAGKTLTPFGTVASMSVTLDPQDGSGGTESVTVTNGAGMPTITLPTRTGYTFGGYYEGMNGDGTKYYNADGSSANNWNHTGESFVIYAKWTPNTYTVTLEQEAGSDGTPSVDATFGAAMPSATMPTRDGYIFGGYFTEQNGNGTQYYNADGSSAKAWDIAQNTTLHAKWEGALAGGASEDLAVTIENGQRPHLTGGWYKVNGDVTFNQTVTLHDDTYLVLDGGLVINAASGNGIECGSATLTLSYSSASGSIKANSYNGTVQIASNRKFETDDDPTPVEVSGTVSNNSIINGRKLTPKMYTVSFYTGEGGSVVAPQSVAHGLTATQPTNPTRDGYSFSEWQLNSSAYDFTSAVTEDITLTAEWNQLGDLKITNTLVSDLAADADAEFTFTVTLGDNTISGTYGDMAFTSGVATVTLKDGEYATATGLLYGTSYNVTQTEKTNFVTTPEGESTFNLSVSGTLNETEETAEFMNTRETGDLELSVVVESNRAADADVGFTFTVTLGDNTISGTYGDMTFAGGKATVTLKGGESATASGLPTTVTYTITQTAQTGFNITDKIRDTGTISTEMSTAEFTNTRETGDLTVSNTVVSDKTDDAGVEFTFMVTLGDTSISGEYGDMTFTEGVATVTLKGGETATASGLPTEITYTVTQTAQTGFNVTGKTGDTGTISQTGSTAEFTNTRLTASLTVSNTVYGDNTQEFEYTVTLEGTTTTGTHGDMEFTNGVATFSLKNGDHVTATNLPTGVNYTVTQTVNDETAGFATTQSGNTGTISTTTAATAAFKNIKLMTASISIDWKDGDGSGRPEALTVNLLWKLKDSESEPLPVNGQQNKTLNASNYWIVTIAQLPMYDDAGAEIEYSWSAITTPNGYLLTDYDTGANASYTFTKATSPTLAVTWDDNNNQDGLRPSSLDVTLVGDVEYGTYEILSEGGWTTTVNGLPMYDGDNNLITYTWTVTTNLPQGYTLPNTSITTELTISYTPETTSSTVIVNWDDQSNQDNIRPTALTATLLADGVALAQQPTISWEKGVDSWTATVTGLQKNDNGTEIAYTWTVTSANLPQSYTLANTNTNEGTTSLALRHAISRTAATLQITWYDANNVDSRPSVSADLYVGENPGEYGSVTLDSGNGWKASIGGLPMYANGEAIVYTWKLTEGSKTELSDAGYTSSAEPSTSGTVTTLTYRKAAAQSAFTFAESNVTKRATDGLFTIEPTGAQDNPTITYSSSNVAVAGVDASTGEVTINGSGVTTITATAAETNNYLSATAKYTLTVTGGSTVNIQLTEDYGTFCWDQDLDFSEAGLDAYIAAGFNASTGVLTMVKVTSVPAGTGLLLIGSAGNNYTATVQTSTWVYANLLRGTTEETALYAGGRDFILSKKNNAIGFYPVGVSGNIAAFKAYLHLDDIPHISNARGFISLSFEDDATALDAVRWKKETGIGDAWYSLDGRKLQGKPTVKGLYIHNGKKTVVK